MFNYGSFKLLLLKIFTGIFLVFFSLFLIVSIFTYNSNDPGLGKIIGNSEILNFFGFWGAISSSIIIVISGKASLLLIVFVLYVGIFLVLGVNIKKLFLKFILVLLSLNLINISLILQQTFEVNSGLFSKIKLLTSHFFIICKFFLFLIGLINAFTVFQRKPDFWFTLKYETP